MEGLYIAVIFIFSILGLVAYVRLERLTKTLKDKGVLGEDYNEG